MPPENFSNNVTLSQSVDPRFIWSVAEKHQLAARDDSGGECFVNVSSLLILRASTSGHCPR
jgi:hypothetical protein